MTDVAKIVAREILDSRGNPTVEVDVLLSDGSVGRASVPSGASTGAGEALELRDGDPDRFHGRGVFKAIENVTRHIAPAITGRSALDQEAIDRLLIELDGTPNKGNLGANALLGVSMAVASAAARSRGQPLYTYLETGSPPTLPVPFLNIINGGKHAEDSADFQEFMVVPAGFDTFRQALRAGVEVYHALKDLLLSRGFATNVGDEGGFAPSLASNREALDLIVAAIESAGYVPGTHCFLALDVAAPSLVRDDGSYLLSKEQTTLAPGELIDRYEDWADHYPIVSIEDGISEDDWDSWRLMTSRLGEMVQLVGDDLYVTNTALIRKGIDLGASNAVLIKVNQIGTLTETLEAVSMANNAGWGTMISHRSGETEHAFISDLAVATAAGQMKAGAPARSDRTAKYNRLLRIEEELGERATFAGPSVFEQFLRQR